MSLKVNVGLILFTFIILKITNAISWSWWVVLIPLYVEIAIILGVALFYFMFINKKRTKKKK